MRFGFHISIAGGFFKAVPRAVKLKFDEEGVSIPFPQRDVHLYQETVPQVPGEADTTTSSKGHPSSAPRSELSERPRFENREDDDEPQS